jgi:Ser/Thr protein kinase RdoA (MazF antagonist)
MSLTVAEAAARAAVSVAAGLGVRSREPVVLADGANVVVYLSPAPVVAKVAASTPEVRVPPADWLARELDVSGFLAGAGAAVVAPSPEVPATVHAGAEHVMSFWTYVPGGGGRRADEDTIMAMLRELHEALRGYPRPLPPYVRLDDIPRYLDRPQTRLGQADRAVLAEAYRKLMVELGPSATGGRVLHGDAGAGNLMAAGGGWAWHDFEDACTGPAEWDLAASTASKFMDRDKVLAAYGQPYDAGLLMVCEDLRRLHLTVWYHLYAERLPDCAPRAAELMAQWRERAAGGG